MEYFKENQREGIPNDDVFGWMETLRGGGLSAEEIDKVLEESNLDYWRAKNITSIEKGMEIIKRKFFEKSNRNLTKEETEYFKILLEKILKDKELDKRKNK